MIFVSEASSTHGHRKQRVWLVIVIFSEASNPFWEPAHSSKPSVRRQNFAHWAEERGIKWGTREIRANTVDWERTKRKWWPDLSSSFGLCQHWDRWLPQRIPGKTLSGEIHILGAVRKRPQRSGHLGDLNPLSPLSDPRHHLIRKATITLIMGLLQIIYCSDQLWTQNF